MRAGRPELRSCGAFNSSENKNNDNALPSNTETRLISLDWIILEIE